VKNQWFSFSILLTWNSVWQITFSGWIFFRLFPQIWNQRKILRILNTHKPKKNKKIFGVIEYIYEYMLELVEYKFARNGLTNWKTFLTNIFENIIWHLCAGESHQVVKITVPYCRPLLISSSVTKKLPKRRTVLFLTVECSCQRPNQKVIQSLPGREGPGRKQTNVRIP
jgi:hypothetical protein